MSSSSSMAELKRWAVLIAGIAGLTSWILFGRNSSDIKDMPMEVLLGVALAIWFTTSAKTFKEIRATEDIANKSPESFLHRPSFITFNHRGKQLFGAD